MKKLLMITCLFTAIGCYKDLPELDYNVFGDESRDLFQFQGYTKEKITSLWDVKIKFTHVYDELGQVQKYKIVAIKVFRDGHPVTGLLTKDKTEYMDKVLYSHCYQFAYLSVSGELSRKSDEFCIEIP